MRLVRLDPCLIPASRSRGSEAGVAPSETLLSLLSRESAEYSAGRTLSPESVTRVTTGAGVTAGVTMLVS